MPDAPRKPWRGPITGFLGRFALIYGLMILPWPGWEKVYGDYFRDLGRLVFQREHARLIVRFSPLVEGQRPRLDTRIAIANRELLTPAGQGPAVLLAASSRSVGWLPTCLVAALILATPVSWRRRMRALVMAMILVHGFIVFFLGLYIGNHSDASSGLRLVTFPPALKTIVSGLEQTFLRSAAIFAIAVFIWIFTLFRRRDLENGPLLRTPP